MFRAFFRSPGGIIGIAVIFALLALAAIAPEVLGQQAMKMDMLHANQHPTAGHILGTDRLGRDIFIRIVVATRLSIGLGAAATLLAGIIGIPLGAMAGMLKGRLRILLLRSIDTMLAFSAILVALFVSAIIGAGAAGSVLGVGIALSFSFARVVSSLTLSIAGRDFIHAARLINVGRTRLILRHVLPNIAETMALQTTFAFTGSIVAMSSLSFLGVGIQPPLFDWGRMLTEGVASMYVTPAAALGPAAAIAITAIAFGFVGEALARSTNPRLWGTDRHGAAPQPATAVSLAPVEADAGRELVGAPILAVQDLVVRISSNPAIAPVVDHVSFAIARGETVGIVGESGSGKTLTALAIAQLIPAPITASGKVTLDGAVLGELSPEKLNRWLGTKLAFVFQDPMSSLTPTLKLAPQLTEAVRVHRGLGRREARALAAAQLNSVNLPTPEVQLRRYPHELSGGMRQRTMIAMGLMNEPTLLIADEPTTALDVTIQAQIMDLLARCNRERGMAILLISHNIGLVSQNCHRIIVMYAGCIVEQGSVTQVTRQALHPYSRALMASVPEMQRQREVALEFIPGSMPDPSSLPSGCAFHPRCGLAIDRCRIERPPLRVRSDGHGAACWVANRDLS